MQNQTKFCFAAPQAPSLLQHCEPTSYDFSIKTNVSAQGDQFELNAEGRVVGARYASGAIVKILDQCMIVRAENFALWFADRQQQFHPID